MFHPPASSPPLPTSRRWLPLVPLAATLLAVLVWAGWEEPALHEFAPPVQFATLQASGLRTAQQVAHLQQAATALPGVTACAVNLHTQCLTIAWQPDLMPLAELRVRLQAAGHVPLRELAPVALTGAAAARQCPVPVGYVQALEHLRFQLNVRRFFVRA